MLIFLYTDPGSGALLLQLIIAGILGGMFYIRRIKNKIFGKKLESKAELLDHVK